MLAAYAMRQPQRKRNHSFVRAQSESHRMEIYGQTGRAPLQGLAMLPSEEHLESIVAMLDACDEALEKHEM